MEIKEKIPIMTYSQYRRARKLVHQCCNYESGNCLALDDGEECVCIQSISYSLLCRWFRSAVLPLDESLETALLYRKEPSCTSALATLTRTTARTISYVPTTRATPAPAKSTISGNRCFTELCRKPYGRH